MQKTEESANTTPNATMETTMTAADQLDVQQTVELRQHPDAIGHQTNRAEKCDMDFHYDKTTERCINK